QRAKTEREEQDEKTGVRDRVVDERLARSRGDPSRDDREGARSNAREEQPRTENASRDELGRHVVDPVLRECTPEQYGPGHGEERVGGPDHGSQVSGQSGAGSTVELGRGWRRRWSCA